MLILKPMPRKKSTTKLGRVYPKKTADVPVTQGMLFGVRDELKFDVKSLEQRMDARFSELDARFDKIDARFSNNDSQFKSIDSQFKLIDSRFNSMEARFSSIDAQFSEVKSEIRRLAVIVEEQNARNAIVLDGLTALFGRQERLEVRVDGLEGSVIRIK